MTEEIADAATGEIKPRTFHPVGAEFVTFTRDGETRQGYLRAKGTADMQSGPVGKYTIMQDDGKMVAFLGGAILDDAFAVVDLGAYVRVTLDGIEKRSGGHTLKHFTVEVADE